MCCYTSVYFLRNFGEKVCQLKDFVNRGSLLISYSACGLLWGIGLASRKRTPKKGNACILLPLRSLDNQECGNVVKRGTELALVNQTNLWVKASSLHISLFLKGSSTLLSVCCLLSSKGRRERQ